MNIKTVTLVTSLMISMGVPAMDKQSSIESQIVKKASEQQVMCAEKTGGFNLVNYRHSSGVYHEQETEDLHRRI